VLFEIWSLDGNQKSAFTGQELSRLDASLKVYPNPVNDNKEFVIEVEGFGNETSAVVNIFDITGKMAYSVKLATLGNDVMKHGVMSDRLSGKGMYFITVTSGNKVANTKIIVD